MSSRRARSPSSAEGRKQAARSAQTTSTAARAGSSSDRTVGGSGTDRGTRSSTRSQFWSADSAGQRKKVGELLGWFHESEGLARPVVQALGDADEIVGAQEGKVGALGHVLAEEPVGVLVRAALPGAVGIAEVDLHPGVDGEEPMARQLAALIPRERSHQLGRQVDDRLLEGLVDLEGLFPLGKVDEHEG